MVPRVIGLIAAAVALSAGCGADDDPRPRLKVSAAASLKGAFTAYAARFADAGTAMSFAGSDELAAQVRQGARPDVFASANTKLPDELFARGLVERPVVFTTNELVLAVPRDAHEIESLDDAAGEGVRLAMGDRDVPVGRYTRALLAQLPPTRARAILTNVRSEEPDVNGIVGKLAQGAVDGGFVYRTDVRAAERALRAIRLPERLRPRVAYAVAVVEGSAHAAQARAFVAGLLRGPGREALAAAGFGPPPPR